MNGPPIRRRGLVVFDVDGTLHDTSRWWPSVLRAGLVRFTAQTGLALDVPDDAAANAVVGMRDAGVWAPFLPQGHKDRWSELRSVVLPMEVDVLRSGEDHLFPGVREILTTLRQLGIATALASNCRSAYFGGICEGQGLAALTDWQFCLDSEGVRSKTDMVAFAMAAAGPVPAVMVGDREPDLEAARAVGIPFLWRPNPACDLPSADGRWDGSLGSLLRGISACGISFPASELPPPAREPRGPGPSSPR
jgi:phosphoglycolate phosphatase-like HAD superfamily hydrolase